MNSNPRIISLLFFLIVFKSSSFAQEIWGMTQYGGTDNKGVIFKMDENADGHQVVFSFESMGLPEGGMTEYSDGTFYGMTTNGGRNDCGVIYQFDPADGSFTKIVDFDGISNGKDGAGSMLQASNNKLYGMTAAGGVHEKGVIFEFDPATEELVAMVNFDGSNTGGEPLGSLVEGPDGNLFGMTSMGGEHDMGVLFVYNYHTSSFEKIFDFGSGNAGSNPMGSLIVAADNKLYGMTRWGGQNDHGTIFRLEPESREVEVVFEFNGPETGRNPQGSLLEASNGKLYGTTAFGGEDNMGVLFEFDYNTLDFIKKTEFKDPFFRLSGSLVEGENNRLFGVNHSSYNDIYVLLEYDLTSGRLNNYSGSDNGLRDYYGNVESIIVTSNGNLFFWGRDDFYIDKEIFLFEFDPEQNEIVNYYKNSTCHTGSYPHGELVQASNGMLYAMTKRGGMYDAGTIFEYDPRQNTINTVMNFDDEQSGAEPLGSLILYDDSLLYGMTSKGGEYDYGVLFRFNLNDKSYTKLADFDGTDHGRNPMGNLLKASNGVLYGMTPQGGTHDLGVMFRYDPETGVFVTILNFIGDINGRNPQGSLMQASNGKIYGVTGTSLFEYDYESNSFKKLKDSGGRFGELLQASNDHFYFSARSAVYGYDPEMEVLTEFTIPYIVGHIGKLLEYVPGKLLGMAYGEVTFNPGTEHKGSLFELDIESGTSEVKVFFNGEDGRHPNNSGLAKVNLSSGPPVACKPYTLYLDESGYASLNPADIFNGVPVEGSVLSVNKRDFTCGDVGDNEVVLTVTDADGNKSACNAMVTVVDTISPRIVAKDIDVYLDENGTATIDATDVDEGSSDACGIDEMQLSQYSFSCDNLGENIIEMIVTDIYGNSSSQEVTVFVADTTAPVITCPDDLTAFLNPDEQIYQVANDDMIPDAADNCTIEELMFSVNGGEALPSSSFSDYSFLAGSYEIKWTATDNSNNLAECTSVLDVRKRATSLVVHNVEVIESQNVLAVEASLMDDLLLKGIGGKPLVFNALGVAGTAVTNDEGVAEVTIPINEVYAASLNVSVVFEGDEVYSGSTSGQEVVTSSGVIAEAEVAVYPNPFADRLNFRFVAPETTTARIDVFDPSGRLVKTVLNRNVVAGMVYTAVFVNNDISANHFLYRIQIGQHRYSGKVIPMNK